MQITIAELYKNYGMVNALADVNLKLAGGQAVALERLFNELRCEDR